MLEVGLEEKRREIIKKWIDSRKMKDIKSKQRILLEREDAGEY